MIPEGYTIIDTQSFENCTGLTGTPQLPSTLQQIFSYAFRGCTGLTGTLYIGDEVTVYSGAFDGTQLTVIQNGNIIYQPD